MIALIVVENPQNWDLGSAGGRVVSARDYLTDPAYSEMRGARVVNLCRTYSFQTTGYYVSLLAAARGHKPIPSVSTLQDLRLSPVVRVVSEELQGQVERAFKATDGERQSLRIFFGSMREGPQRLGRAVFNHLPAPLLQAEFVRSGTDWRLENVRALATSDLTPEERAFVAERLSKHFQGRATTPPAVLTPSRYDLAILCDPEEPDAPSDERALQAFVRAAGAAGIAADLIGKDDYGYVAEYDALFIRSTTAVDHYTYRFARRAEAAGLVVIDAPKAILQATNKVYQAELFQRHGVPTPKTRLVHRDNVDEAVAAIGFPIVLKRPDSSFSQGVKKAADRAELDALLAEFFRSSDLVVAQEFTPSEFDFRIGVIDREFLFGARYYMAPGHWQIQRTGQGKWRRFGKVEALAPEEIPPPVLEAGVRAAGLLGDGLFGVDVKLLGERVLVMEVNDNPNIDYGYEDRILGEELYARIMRSFLRRLEARGRERGSS